MPGKMNLCRTKGEFEAIDHMDVSKIGIVQDRKRMAIQYVHVVALRRKESTPIAHLDWVKRRSRGEDAASVGPFEGLFGGAFCLCGGIRVEVLEYTSISHFSRDRSGTVVILRFSTLE